MNTSKTDALESAVAPNNFVSSHVEEVPAPKKQRLSTASILAASVAHITTKNAPVVPPLGTSVSVAPTELHNNSHAPVAASVSKVAKAVKALNAPKVAKKDLPHVLIWVAHNGNRQGSGWTNNSLRIVGVYGSKAEAEQKKSVVMDQYEQCGHGDILVGGTCWDEIDLVVCPVGECTI